MFVIAHHDPSIYNSLIGCGIFGPYDSLTAAKQALTAHVASMNDSTYMIQENGLEARSNDPERWVYAEILPLKVNEYPRP